MGEESRQLSSSNGKCWIVGGCSASCQGLSDGHAEKCWLWDLGALKLCAYHDTNSKCEARGLEQEESRQLSSSLARGMEQEESRQLSSSNGKCWIVGGCPASCQGLCRTVMLRSAGYGISER